MPLYISYIIWIIGLIFFLFLPAHTEWPVLWGAFSGCPWGVPGDPGLPWSDSDAGNIRKKEMPLFV